MTSSKKIVIFAGPNGAGKTTFAAQFLPNEADFPPFVNADLIAKGLSPLNPNLAAFQSGRLMLSMIRDHVTRGESFAFETTLIGRGYARLIPQWQEQGYRVDLLFLRLPAPEVAVDRVRQRVSQVGHHIPEETIHRRFHAGWRNFESIYRDLVDDWALCENSGPAPVLLERKEDRL